MWKTSWLALALVFAGCSGDTTAKDTTDTTTGDDDDDTTTDGGGGGDSGGGGFGGDVFDEMAAVGFEFEGILLADGSFTSFNYGAYTIEPTLYLTFTTFEYFSAASTLEQEEQSCVAFGTWNPGPLAAANNIQAVGNPNLNWSWEGPISLEFSDCPDKMEAALWDEILNAFNGARFGMGVSTMNQTFLDKWGISDYPEYVGDWEEFGLVEYIAVNDREGNFLGRNWNAGFMYQWDSSTEEIVVDNGYLVPIPVSGTPGGTPLPEGYLRSNAFWYADFCRFLDANGYQASAEESCLDLTNLKDGAR